MMNTHIIINIQIHSDDSNHVLLSEIPDVDYINASYVDVSIYYLQ